MLLFKAPEEENSPSFQNQKKTKKKKQHVKSFTFWILRTQKKLYTKTHELEEKEERKNFCHDKDPFLSFFVEVKASRMKKQRRKKYFQSL